MCHVPLVIVVAGMGGIDTPFPLNRDARVFQGGAVGEHCSNIVDDGTRVTLVVVLVAGRLAQKSPDAPSLEMQKMVAFVVGYQ